MSKRLSGSAGTGKKIMQNLNQFSYTYQGFESLSSNTLHKFNWNFGIHSGTANIMLLPDGTINQSSLIDCKAFPRPLGAYNDDTLYNVFRMMLQSQNITYK